MLPSFVLAEPCPSNRSEQAKVKKKRETRRRINRLVVKEEEKKRDRGREESKKRSRMGNFVFSFSSVCNLVIS